MMNSSIQARPERSGCQKGGPLLQVAAWISRVLFLTSIVFCILDFAMAGTIIFGILYMVLAIFAFLSPLTWSCCCVWKCTNCTTANETCGRIAMYVWLFLSNLAYVISFAYTWSFGVAYIGSMNYMSGYREDDTYYYGYDYHGTEGLRNTLFAFLLIYTFIFSILNMYTVCLVSKFGCCFVEGMDAEMNNRTQNNAAQPLQVVSSSGSQYPTTSMQGIIFTQAGPAYINGAAFPSSLPTVTSQHIMTPQFTPATTFPSSAVGHQECVDLPPPYAKGNAI